jgi:predicted nucleic acid-binding protein
LASFAAVYDACVLYPAPLRDLLVRLGQTGLFRARWTDRIHEEWIRNLLANRPDLKAAQLARSRELMNLAVPDCLVRGYEPLIDGLALPDPDDRHVLAAAICSQAGVIVTYNRNDFPVAALEPYGIEVQHPDEFIRHVFDLSPAAVCQVVREQRASLVNPPRSSSELLATFLSCGLASTVAALEEMQSLL